MVTNSSSGKVDSVRIVDLLQKVKKISEEDRRTIRADLSVAKFATLQRQRATLVPQDETSM